MRNHEDPEDDPPAREASDWPPSAAHVSAGEERDDFLAGVCVALQCVTAEDNGVLWREIVETAGVESLLRYATFVEPDEWELAGFARYARNELRRARPRKCVPPLKTPNVGSVAGPAARDAAT